VSSVDKEIISYEYKLAHEYCKTYKVNTNNNFYEISKNVTKETP